MLLPKTPPISADTIIEYKNGIVIIERLNEPVGFALPGGFIEIGEKVEDAARREAKEETGLDVKIKGLLGVYSDPKRDPRGHVVTLVFIGEADSSQELRAGDDAKRAYVFDPEKIPFDKLVFDHPQIIKDYLEWKKSEIKKVFVR
jgi:ADP-ribose pyrophosphatase YjhB (NUDIX family)